MCDLVYTQCRFPTGQERDCAICSDHTRPKGRITFDFNFKFNFMCVIDYCDCVVSADC